MTHLLPTALRSRLAVLFALSVGLVITLAVALLALGVDHQFDDAIDAGLAARASGLTTAVATGDYAGVRGDELAEVVTTRGHLVVRSSRLDLLPGARAREGSTLLAPEQLRRAASASPSDPVEDDRRVPGLGGVRLRAQRVSADGRGAVLVVASQLDPIYDAEGRLLLLFVAGALPLVLLLGLAGWLLAGAALRPVAAMTARAAQISSADVDQRLPQPVGTDEIAALAATLNRMLARVEAGVRREREFVDDAAHELRTPVAVLRGELELALRQGRAAGDLSPDVEESLASALSEAERLSRLAQDLLVLATAERSGQRSQPLELLARASAEVDRMRGVHSLAVDVLGSEVVVLADQRDVGRLLTNLLANAEAAGATRVVVVVEPRDAAGVLRVDDDGPGFAPALLATATERFTRVDPARTRGASGAGLGLAIVAALAKAHGGDVVLLNGGRLGGASVRVRLPASPRAGAPG